MSATARLRPKLSEAALHGFPGHVARVLSAETGADIAGILLTFLCMLGNAIGPEPHVLFGTVKHSARLFAVLVGDAGTGGKGTIRAVVGQLFAVADPQWYLHRLTNGLQSAEAMIVMVADGPSGDCRELIDEPEFGRLISRMKSSGTVFTAQFRNAYDGVSLDIKVKGSSVRSSKPHISALLLITPEELRKHREFLRSAGGLETRLPYCLVARQNEVSPFTPPNPAREALIDQLRHVIESSRDGVMNRTDPISRYLCLARGVQPSVEMPIALAVSEAWESVKARLPRLRPEFAAMAHRAEVHVIRFALAYAVADESPVLLPVHIDAALALWTYCALSMERIFSTPTGGLPPTVDFKRRGQMFEYLCERNDWVPRNEILGDGLFRNNLGKEDFDAIVESLLAEDLIESRTIHHTGGAPRREYRIAVTHNPVTP